MRNENRMGSRLVMIGLAVILLTAVIWLIGTSLQQNVQNLELSEMANEGAPSIPVEINEFEESAKFITHLNASDIPTNTRDLIDYYSLRAYSGAPPVIPHTVADQSFGGNDCLICHATGDYVPQAGTYAPIVPHPELLSCNQCHVPANTDTLFIESDWETFGKPQLGQSALPGSPPPIPHDLQMHENCLACHAGLAAPTEIRVSHPERENCVQCHVQIESNEEWER